MGFYFKAWLCFATQNQAKILTSNFLQFLLIV
nr:MAG TPA: hypothetical protein [Bacteriophage sp.]